MDRRGVLRAASALGLLALLGACATAPVAPPALSLPAGVAADLAPSGTLRAAINFGNGSGRFRPAI